MIPGFGFDESFVHPPMPEGFCGDSAGLRGRTAPESHYTPSPGMRVGFRDLSRREIDYYLWWRSEVLSGRAPETDEGYVWLMLAELVNSDDAEASLEGILRIVDSYPDVRLGIVSSRDCAVEYAMIHGLPMDPRMYSPFSEHASAVIHGLMMRYPTEDLDTKAVLTITHNDDKYAEDPERAVGILNLALRCMDEYDRSRYGAGIARCHGEQFSPRVVDVFRGLPYGGNRNLVRPGPANTGGDSLTEFIAGAWRAVLKAMWRKDHPRGGPTVPKGFAKEYRAIADRVVGDVLSGKDVDPAEHRYTGPGCHRGPFHDDVPDITDNHEDVSMVSDPPHAEEDTEDPGWLYDADPVKAAEYRRPVVIQDRGAIVLKFGRETMEDVVRYRSLETDVDAPYVPSGATVMTWAAMDRHQRAFYLRWRTLATKHEYRFTDAGYLGLYLSELVNSDLPADEVTEEILRIRDTYLYTSETESMIDDALESHGLLTGTHVPALREGDTEFNKAVITRKLMSSPIADMEFLEATFVGGCMYDRNGLSDSDEGMCGRGVTSLLRALDARLEKEGKRLYGLFADSGETCRVRLFRTVFFDGPHDIDIPVLDFGKSYDGRRVVRCAVRNVLNISGLSERGSPHITPWMEEVLAEAAADWWKSEERRARVEKANSVVLSGSAVVSAERDLAAVAGMMSVEDDVVEQEAPQEPEAEATCLRDALDDLQKEYLRAALEGPFAADTVLRRSGKLMSVLEDSINGAAMRFVGDSIVEGGQAVPEYIDEIREALGD